MKFICSLIFSLMVLASQWTLANDSLRIIVPLPNNAESSIGSSSMETDDHQVIGFFQLINKYLWVALVVMALVALVYAGFKLMTGSESSLTLMWKILLSVIGAVLLAIFSYVLVRLIANLF